MSFNWHNIQGLNLLCKNLGEKNTIVLLHGYGANAEDLAPLVHILNHENQSWIFPNAPIKMFSMPAFEGFTWFPLDGTSFAKLENPEDPKTYNFKPEGLETAAAMVLDALTELDLNPANVILGGFSQGAMVATQMALTSPKNFAGLIVMSGTIICQDAWRSALKDRTTMPVFLCHGEQDDRLPASRAIALSKMMQEEGLMCETHFFNGGHEIPQTVLGPIKNFIINCFDQESPDKT
jgi:phospholipase/carboxylesterase